jgi:hypothetical protein
MDNLGKSLKRTHIDMMKHNREQIKEVMEVELECLKNAGIPIPSKQIRKWCQMTVWDRVEYVHRTPPM